MSENGREVVVRTEAFEVSTPRGTLRGRRQYDPRLPDPRGTVLIAPPFGVQMRRGQASALYFLFNGYDVIRYDPTNHVGSSDGEILDLTSSGLVEDMNSVANWALAEARGPLLLFGTSVSARLALAMTAAMTAGVTASLAAIGSISAVVDMAKTMAVAGDRDVVAEWLAGKATDPGQAGEFLSHRIRWRFVEDLVDRGWHTLDSTIDHLAKLAATPVLTVQGAKDRWVDVAEVRRAFGGTGGHPVVTLSDAVHALNPASARTAMAEIVGFYHRSRGLPDTRIATPAFPHVVAQSKSEKALERADSAPFAEVTHRVAPADSNDPARNGDIG